jgi:uncharacterized caspase-like protein
VYLEFCSDRNPDDQLLVYLSCHGLLDGNGLLYYAATDTRQQSLAATAVSAARLTERPDDCRARGQILVLDCCHSGAFARGNKGDRDSVLDLKQRFQPTGRGRVVLTASRATEYSFEGDQASGEGLPSVFTWAVVDGLKSGEADRDRDGLALRAAPGEAARAVAGPPAAGIADPVRPVTRFAVRPAGSAVQGV